MYRYRGDSELWQHVSPHFPLTIFCHVHTVVIIELHRHRVGEDSWDHEGINVFVLSNEF